MKSLKLFLLLGVGVLLFLGAQAWADVPRLINFQGRLTDGSGTAVKDSTYSVLFTIYDALVGGTNLWSETDIVATKGGTFNVNLGSSTALPDTIFNDTTRYLAMKVGTDPEMTPRQRMVSMAYGYRVRTVDGATGGTISGNTAIQSDLYVNGNVGIGTASPLGRLHSVGEGGLDALVLGFSGGRDFGLGPGSGADVDDGNKFGIYDYTVGLTRFLIDGGGNVGIGTTSPVDKLEVGGGGNIALRASADDAGDIIFRTSTGTEKGRVWSDPAVGSNKLFLRGGSTTTGIVIDSAGKVGIGTTTPNEQLEITGNLRLPASTASAGVIKSGADRFIHNFGTNSFFAGVNAGNFTLSGLGNNTGVGVSALQALTTGNYNTAMGLNALSSNTTGSSNTAMGQFALGSNSTGNNNTALGHAALGYNTTGYSNTAVGRSALLYNSTGYNNTAVGIQALYINSTGYNNTAVGYAALDFNSTGTYNTAMGQSALASNTTGYDNTAVGSFAFFTNSTGYDNTAMGQSALYRSTTGIYNTAMGQSALYSNTTGGWNTAVGRNALYGNTTGTSNTAVGFGADVSLFYLNNATAIGYNAIVDASNKVRIGNSSVTSIGGQVGWSVFSDQRLKTNVKKSPVGLDFILKLNPITYNYIAQGQEGITYTGLIAQQVEKVLQELGADFSGLDKPKNKDGYYQLRYAEFVMPLINAMQELNTKNEKLEARLADLEALVKSLAANPSTPNQFNSYEAGAGVTK